VEPAALSDPGAVRFAAWARIWSPLVSDEEKRVAWRGLDLPGTWTEVEADFWPTFHAGLPAPPVPLLLHAALQRDGGGAREDWVRVMEHLGLVWNGRALPPDHLGPACEVLACALELRESVLVAELCRRYLLPWCVVARERLPADSPLAGLPRRFESDLRSRTRAPAS
jgi:hypothetical protein